MTLKDFITRNTGPILACLAVTVGGCGVETGSVATSTDSIRRTPAHEKVLAENIIDVLSSSDGYLDWKYVGFSDDYHAVGKRSLHMFDDYTSGMSLVQLSFSEKDLDKITKHFGNDNPLEIMLDPDDRQHFGEQLVDEDGETTRTFRVFDGDSDPDSDWYEGWGTPMGKILGYGLPGFNFTQFPPYVDDDGNYIVVMRLSGSGLNGVNGRRVLVWNPKRRTLTEYFWITPTALPSELAIDGHVSYIFGVFDRMHKNLTEGNYPP